MSTKHYLARNESSAHYYELLQIAYKQIHTQYGDGVRRETYAPVRFLLETADRPEISFLPFISHSLFSERSESVVPQGVVYGKLLWGAGRTVDDVLDQDTTKDGSPTTWSKYGSNAAVLSSLELTSRAASYLIETSRSLNFENDKIDALLDLLIDHIRDTTYGELNAIVLAKKISNGGFIPEDEFVQMLRYKVASWFYSPLISGCLVADVSKKDQENIREFGTNLGIAYAIFNDVKDVLGGLHDIKVGNANLVISTALNMTEGTSDETLLRGVVKNRSSDIDYDRARKTCYNAMGRLKEEMVRRLSLAEDCIAKLDGVSYPTARTAMHDLISLVK